MKQSLNKHVLTLLALFSSFVSSTGFGDGASVVDSGLRSELAELLEMLEWLRFSEV